MRLLLETSPVKSGDSSLKTVGQIWCRYVHVYSCWSEIIFPRHPKRMKLKFIIMCFIFDIIARIRDLLLSWLDPYGNSIISFLLVSDRLSVMTNCLGLAKLAVRPSVLFLPRTSPKSFQCDFLLGKLSKFRHRSKKNKKIWGGVLFPVPFAVLFSLADCGWNSDLARVNRQQWQKVVCGSERSTGACKKYIFLRCLPFSSNWY